MTDSISLDEAIDAKGVRLILARSGIPSPWSEFCRALFEFKKIPYVLVDARDTEGTYRRLKPLTAQDSVPVVLIEQERPRSSWLEQLYAAERLSLEPSLLPDEPKMRSLVVGWIAELCGENGFGWCRRLQMIDHLQDKKATVRDQQIGSHLAHKYGSGSRRNAERKCEAIVSLLVDRLVVQRASGRSVFVGEHVTALDLAWAAFAALLRPLPEPDCPMQPRWRELFSWTPKTINSEDLALLLAHRDRIYRELLTLPVPTQ